MGFEIPSQLNGSEAASAASPFRPDPFGVSPIGKPLEDIRQSLLALVDDLHRLLGEHASPLLIEVRKQLEEMTCRVAVIGQIKAGKSTFINSLIGQPGLLPTDVNPWTAVVSALHFRPSDVPPEHAAVFQIFSADEWRQIAEGGGRLRELTERLVPGFQLKLLRAQLEVMRKRSELRLGPDLERLLGTCHRYSEITPEILTDYVSAGDPGSVADRSRRNYSDITRSADLYFHEGPFAFPVTVVDTPGTNDPLLVRDEITRRALDDSDVYVFVISALQPLSAADIAMMRLLNGLHKDRIILFINRVDQLANPEVEAPSLKRAAKERLRHEFPALDIPVIIGSAWVAGLPAAEKGNGLELPFQLSWAVDSGGMLEVSAAVTRMICESSVGRLLHQIANCLLELVRSDQVSLKAQIRSSRDLFEAKQTQVAHFQGRVEEEEKSLAALEARATAMCSTFEDVRSHLLHTVENGRELMSDALYKIVRDFSEAKAQALVDAIACGVTTKSWSCDVMPLREKLEFTYLQCFDRMTANVLQIEEVLYPHLQGIVANLLPDYRGSALELPTSTSVTAPSVSSLTRKVTMDLGSHWWKHFLKARRSPDEHAEHLRDLIEADFRPLVGQLIDAAEARLHERVEYTMQRATAVTGGLISGIKQRRLSLALESAMYTGQSDGDRPESLDREHNTRIRADTERLAALDLAEEQLGKLVAFSDSIQAGDRAHA
jgi:Dynamin family